MRNRSAFETQRCETDSHPSLIVELKFLNDSGERRVATVVPMDDRAWAKVAEHALQVLLRQADPSYPQDLPHTIAP